MLDLTAHYALIMAFFWSNFAALSNYASVYLLGHGFRNTEIGMMIAAASLVSAFVQPVLGSYADKPHSPSVKVILLIMTEMFLTAVILISVFADRSPLVLMTAYAAALMLMQSMIPFTNALGTLSAGGGHNVNFGIARGVGSLVYAIVSLIIGRVSERFGIFLIPLSSVGIFIGFGVCLLLFPFRKSEGGKKSEKSSGFFIKYPHYAVILAAAMCLYSSHVLISKFTFQIISSKGGNSESLGVAYAIAAVAELPMMFGFSKLLKKISAGKWMVISGFAYLIKTVGTLLVRNVMGFYFVQTLQILAYAVITVASVYYIDSIMESEDAVKGQALFTMMNTIGGVFASALGGWLLDGSGVTALLIVAIGFAGIGAVVMWIGVSSRKK